MAAVTKIKNFEGYWFRCDKCGREIMHGFKVNGSGCYGSECVHIVAGHRADKTMRQQISREKTVVSAIKTSAKGQWMPLIEQAKSYAIAYRTSVDVMFERYVRHGEFRPV
jgi:hypothetical protein